MKNLYIKAKTLAMSSTARDSMVLFAGNSVSAVLGFLFIYFVGNNMGREDFGVFSAALNLVVIITSISDIGITSGLINFISGAFAEKNHSLSYKYEKAGFVIRTLSVLALVFLVILFPKFIAENFLATNDYRVSFFVCIMSVALFIPLYLPFVLQAKKKFLQSVVVDNSFYLFRLVGSLILIYFGSLTIFSAFSTTVLGFFVSLSVGIYYLGTKFLKSKPDKKIYVSLIKFSGWLGVNRIVSSVTGRLDIQMLAFFLGATSTAVYSIPARLSSFIIVLAGSFSSVLATRFAGFNDKEKEKAYLIKATLATIPIIIFIFGWTVFASFIMKIIFPQYLDSVPVLQALLLANIPFVLTVPPVSAIIYAMKKTSYIGVFSFIHLIAVFLLNSYLIPIFGVYGPTITLGATYTLAAIYLWWIVIRHYWTSKNV